MQQQFLIFREDKRAKESDLKGQIEHLKKELDQIQRDRDTEVQHARLVAETERLGLKSEMEVKLEIMGKENQLLVEERRRMKKEKKDKEHKYESALEAMKRELLEYRDQLIELGRGQESKESIV